MVFGLEAYGDTLFPFDVDTIRLDEFDPFKFFLISPEFMQEIVSRGKKECEVYYILWYHQYTNKVRISYKQADDPPIPFLIEVDQSQNRARLLNSVEFNQLVGIDYRWQYQKPIFPHTKQVMEAISALSSARSNKV